MGLRSQKNYDQTRDKRYSAYVYIGDGIFRKSICLKRDKKKMCTKWKQELLNIKKPQDEEFIKSSMILISESEL